MRDPLRRLLIAFGVLYLIGAAINLPISMQFLQSRIGSPRRAVVDLRDAAARAMPYPTRTPHAIPWPPPDIWCEFEVFGYKRIQARAHLPEINDQLSMQFELTGWPLPVFEQVHCWWPQQHPKWTTSVEPDPVMRLHWKGVLLNPALFTLVTWLAFFAMPMLVRSIVRRRRVRRSLCPKCGYPMGESTRCSECGDELPVERNQSM